METTLKQTALWLVKIGLVGFMAWSAYKMGQIAYPYLVPPYPTDIDFLVSKPAEVQLPHWMVAFYIHIVTSVIALGCGITQFSKTLMYRYPQVHRTLGKAYIFLILGAAAPSGLVMAFYGNGGWAAQVAFVFQAVAWWQMTFLAYQNIRAKRLRKHGEYMLRSYAVSLSAISLRMMSFLATDLKEYMGWFCPLPGGSFANCPSIFCHPNLYILIAWVSWIFNLVLAELLIWAGLMRYYLRGSSHSQTNASSAD